MSVPRLFVGGGGVLVLLCVDSTHPRDTGKPKDCLEQVVLGLPEIAEPLTD